MKGIFVKYNIDNENWTDEEYENQEDREIFITTEDLKELIQSLDKVCFEKGTEVSLISRVQEVWK